MISFLNSTAEVFGSTILARCDWSQSIPVNSTTFVQVEVLFNQYGVRDQLADVLP